MMREPPFSQLHRPIPFDLKGRLALVLGLGDTGLSVARWVEHQGGRARVADTRAAPPRKKDFAGELHAGAFDPKLLEGADLLCLSPGLSLDQPIVVQAKNRGIPVLGDIELFAWSVRKTGSKIIAVTGTNGKTTVTALVGHLLRAAGVDCEVAGNIAPPALDALMKRRNAPAVWVLELSSYQLETTWALEPDAAAMLNLSEDHFDRYAGMDDYAMAKARVFLGGGVQVLNRDDPRSLAMARPDAPRMTFGLDAPSRVMDFGVSGGELLQGHMAILPLDELPIHGMHNAANALAACALACAMGVPIKAMGQGLRSFRGLPHRLELVATLGGVEWYDDSKGTNVGATVAALRGLGKKSIVILGGEGKAQDFAPLAEPVARFSRKALLIGRDAPLIEKVLTSPAQEFATLEAAVAHAAEIAKPGEAVLLSPACASFDMFRDYRHRGEAFAEAVRKLK
jgi:UDP-N-acetylmuramoylalanine--D-glutamate ligase